MSALRKILHSRGQTLLYGYGLAIALGGGAGALAKALPRALSDGLYWLYSGVAFVAIAIAVAATISAAFRNRSMTFLVILLAGSIAIAASMLPQSRSEQNEAVIFTPSLLVPLGFLIAVGTAIEILGRLILGRSGRDEAGTRNR